MGHALYEAALFEGVENRGHRARRDEDTLRDHRRLQRLAGALDDGKDLTRARSKLIVLTRLTVVQLDEQVPRMEQVGEALRRERAGAGIFVFEVVADPSQGFGDA